MMRELVKDQASSSDIVFRWDGVVRFVRIVFLGGLLGWAFFGPALCGGAPLVIVDRGATGWSVSWPFVAKLTGMDYGGFIAGAVVILAWVLQPVCAGSGDGGERVEANQRWWNRAVFVVLMCVLFGFISWSSTDAHRVMRDAASGRYVQRDVWFVVDPIVPFDWDESAPGSRFLEPGVAPTRLTALGGSTALKQFSIVTEQQAAGLRLYDPPRAPFAKDVPVAPVIEGHGDVNRTADFVVLTRDGQRTRISLQGCSTVFQAVDRINQAGEGRFNATTEMGIGIVLHDETPARASHWLGTSENGADVTAQMIHAARLVLLTGFTATTMALLIGVPFGAWLGYAGGAIDLVGMRVIEIVMAVPRFFLVLLVAAMIPASLGMMGFVLLVAAMGLVSWTRPARLVRTEVQRLRDQDFVLAARASGASDWRILRVHVLPAAMGPVLVDAAFVFAGVIMLEISLSFLGVGVPAPEPSWGRLLAQAVDPATGALRWWLAIGPGVAVVGVVLSCHALADRLGRSGVRVPGG